MLKINEMYHYTLYAYFLWHNMYLIEYGITALEYMYKYRKLGKYLLKPLHKTEDKDTGGFLGDINGDVNQGINQEVNQNEDWILVSEDI